MDTKPTEMPTKMSPGKGAHSFTIFNPPVRKATTQELPGIKK